LTYFGDDYASLRRPHPADSTELAIVADSLRGAATW
jgi:hypothetical protein